jgi:maleamate amidohydrolase
MSSGESDLSANYADAFGGRLLFGKRPALLIVDFVMAYLDPASPLYAGVEEALACNERLVATARAHAIPLIFTKVEYAPGGADGGIFYRKVPALRLFERGSAYGAFPPSLQPLESEMIVIKCYASAFFGTPLSSALTAMHIDTLLITGLSTSGCVRATALDACQHGFLPFVVRDACGDRHPAPHESSLFDLQAKYAEVIDSAEAERLIANGSQFRG